MRKDILLICQYFHPEYVSSAKLPFDIATDMSENKISVGVLTGYPKEYSNSSNVKTKEVINNIEVSRLKYLHLKRTNVIGRLINYFSFTTSVLINLKKVKKFKSVMIFSNPPILPIIGVISKKLFGTKFIFVSYDVYPEIAIATQNLQENSIISKLMKFINYIVFKNVDKVVTLSTEMTSILLKNRVNIKSTNMVEIPNWDTTELTDKVNEKNSSFEYLKDKTVISYLGNLGTAQDESIIFEIINLIKNDTSIHFLFAGHGNKVESLKQYIEKYNISNVSIYDFLQGQDFETVLSYTNYSIVSLKNNLSGLAVPSKAYTLLRSGIPTLISMDNQSDLTKDIINHKAGFFVNHNNLENTLDDIRNMSSIDYKNMSENAKDLYQKKYERKLSTDKYIQTYYDLVKE